MRVSIIAALLSSLALFACGGSAHKEAKGPETDPWAGYTGKYAEPATGKAPKAETAKADAKPKQEKAEKPAEKEAKADESATATKTSAATIQGESVSSVGLDTFA